MILSGFFFQTFCANQSPTSYVVEVQSEAENDWLIKLSKKGPPSIKKNNTRFFSHWNLSVCVNSTLIPKRQKIKEKKEKLHYGKSVVLKSLQTPPLYRNMSVLQASVDKSFRQNREKKSLLVWCKMLCYKALWKTTHFKFFSTYIKFGTKSTHFEKKCQSAFISDRLMHFEKTRK